MSLVAVLHDHAVDKAIHNAIDGMDTNQDGIVTFGAAFKLLCMDWSGVLIVGRIISGCD